MRLRPPRKTSDPVLVEGIRKEEGFAYTAALPAALDGDYELWEDEYRLGLGRSGHDDIRTIGNGRYDVAPNVVHFSTSDGSDARQNGRVYTLRLRPARKAGDPVLVEGVRKEEGFAYMATLPVALKGNYELWEGEQRIGPGGCYHADIRTQGEGRYHVGDGVLYFSTPDGSDARTNGRSYQLRLAP